ncbi:MAG: GerAB/ArcD/ProY family transporter [Bacillota bacterium]
MGTFQFAMMEAAFLLGTAIIIIPVLGASEQDMWMAGLIGWVTGVIYALFLSLNNKEPQGHYPLARFILSLYTLHLAALVTRNLGEILNLSVMPNTPQVVFNTILVLLAAYAASQGIEAISRLAGPFVLLSFLAGILLVAMAIPVMKPNHFQPVFEHGFKLIIKDAIPFISFPFMETVVFLPLLKLVSKPRKALLGGVLLAGAMFMITLITIILVLPPERIQYYISPTFNTINSIPQAGFVKAITVLLWIQTGFLKLALLHYVVSKQLAEAFSLNYRKIIIPISILIVNLSILVYNNILEMFSFAFKIYPYYAIPLQIGIPLYFLIAGRLSNRASPAKS